MLQYEFGQTFLNTLNWLLGARSVPYLVPDCPWNNGISSLYFTSTMLELKLRMPHILKVKMPETKVTEWRIINLLTLPEKCLQYLG